MVVDGTSGAPIWLVVVISAFLILYSFFDIAYFARMAYTILKARYFKNKICIMEKTELKCKFSLCICKLDAFGNSF